MRSNVKKMWTALLAVLFAAAVGFGLWFAFAPAARPANVHAAEETTVEIKKTENASTLYSNQPVEQLLGQFISGTVTLAGASTPSDLLSFAATGGVSYQVYAQYDAEQDQLSEERDDLRPDSDETAESYSRWVVAIAEVDGVPIESNPLELTVTKATIISLTAWFSGNNTFSALTAIPQDAPLTVQVMYSPGAGQPFSPDRGSEYGTYQIIYNQEGEYTDRLEYRDTSITIKYTEGNVSKSVPVAVNVSEAYVETPRWKDYNVVPELSYTGEERTVELEKYDSTSLTNDANVESEGGILSLTGTDAGEYSVTISVKEGYKFREDFPQYATATYKDGKIVALKYTWKITQASINSVTVAGNWKDGWTFGTPDAAPTKDNVELNILYEGSSETVTKSPDEVGATVTFAFSGTANDGTTITDSTTPPTKAGSYTWRVELTGMNNFNDFTGSGTNGGAGSFVIQKKSLDVPSLASNELPYNGSAQSATATYEEDHMTFDGALDGEERINVGTYHATFTLTDPDNFKWEEGADVSGEKNKTATVTWKIVQAENEATVSLEDWTYGTTANSPSLKADFGAGTVKYTYSGTTNAGDSYSGDTAPTEAGSYTVKATIAGTKNYKGATATNTFEVLRAPIGLPSFTTSTFSYNGQNQTPEFSAGPSGFSTDLAAKKDANTYTVTATPDGNHQWNTANASGLYVYNYELKWTISPAEIGVEGTLSIKGWMYGGYDESANKPGGVTLDDDTNALLGTATATFKYEYKLSSEGSAYTTSVPTDAGDYTVRLTISVNNNFTPYSTTYNFTIAKKTVNVNWSETPLTYNGEEQAPTAKTNDFVNDDDVWLTVSGGQTNAGENYTATAELSGDDAKNYVLDDSKKSTFFMIAKKSIGIDWGTTKFTYNGEEQAPTAKPTGVVDGDDLTLTVTVSGEHKNADDYTAEASLSGNDAGNYQLPADATKEFVIHKLEVRIQALGQTGRQLEHTGSPLSPSITLIGPDGVQLEGVATQQGFYDSAQSELGSEPSAYGSYYVLWKLNDSTNYAWGAINESDQISGFKDKIDGVFIYIAYQITGSSYKITISANNWTVGDTLQDLFSVAAADGYQDKYEAALNEGLTVTYTFLNAAGQQQIGKAIDVTVNAANQNFALTAASIPEGVALNAGTYTLRVEFSESANKNYASAWASATFTVSPYVLKDGDVKWTVPSGLIYKGTEYTFGGEDPNIYATYKTWSYANGVYSATENGDYLTLALTGEAEEILNAGDYILSASLPEKEHAVALPTDAAFAKKPITVSPKKINVTLKGYSETYKGEAFSGSFKTEDHANNGKMLFTIEGAGLCGSDTLEGTFTYPENAINAGIYAWRSIAWSNGNYLVTVTNEKNEKAEVFTIDPAPITVQIENKSSVYGNEIADLTYIVTGNLYDTADTIFSLSTEATNTSNVGEYAIEGSVLEGEGNRGGNYKVKFVNAGDEGKEYGTYTIKPRPVKIVLNDSFQSIYGTDITKSGTLITESGLRFDSGVEGSNTVFLAKDSSAETTAKSLVSLVITGDGSYSATSDAETTWTLTASLTAQTEDVLKNYTFEEAESTMTVKPRPITVEISDVSVTYGTAGTLGVNSVSYTGGGSSEAVISSDLAGGDGAEKYANVFTLALYENNSGTLGEPIDPNDYGRLNRGEYLISLTKVSENYEITFEDATYTVNAQSIDVILVLDTRGHEGSSPVFDGLAWKYLAYGSDESGASIEKIIFHVTYYHALQDERGDKLNGAPVNAGSYYAVVDTVLDEDGNYIAGGSFSVPFTIAQREVSVTWTESTFTYNGKDQFDSVKATYLPWENGSQVTESEELSITGQTFKDWREEGYTFTASFSSDLEKQNYTISGATEGSKDEAKKVYIMERAPITVAIKPQTSIYGEKTVDLTVGASKEKETALYTVTGNLYDNANTIFSLSTAVTSMSDVGRYDIVGSVLEGEGLINSGNYKVTFVDADDSGVSYGTYTVDRRPVQIALDDFSMIYGTDISAVDNHEKLVSLSGLSFKLGTDTTGSPFLTKDSGAEAAAKRAMTFGFTGSGTYGAQSAANTTWTVTASLSDQASDDLKNYTFVADTSTMKVIPRPITVTLPQPGSNGSTSYIYGTAALQNAFPTFKASEALSDDWAGYGEPIVFNDNAEGGVYTLVVKNEDGGVTTLSASTPVGTYKLDGKKGGDSNYSVTFTTEQTFEVTAAEFKVNAEDPVSVSVVYTGKNYYFRSDAEAKENPADTYLFNYGLNVTTADFVLSEGDIAYTWDFKVGDNSLTCLTDAGTYEVSYTVTAENFETVTGSFTVTIFQAKNSWTAGMTTTDGGAYEQASWTYGDPNVYSSLEWTDTFRGYLPSTQFVAAFGKVHIEYYKTRTEAEGGYKYSDQITDPGTFFGCETAVGTYYVKVYVPETNNYKGLTAHGTIEVGKRALDIDWAANNITVDGVTHEGTNTTIGFVNTLMTVDTESLPQGLTIEGKPNESGFTGEITVKVEAEGTTQFYLYFELIDPDNYCWEESATVSGDKGERIQINFTTNALQNNVTFKFKGQDDDPSQNTGISISFGTELTYRFATSSGDTIGDEHLLIFADSTLADETQNYYISFARTTQGDEQPRDDSYTLASLNGADAGYYWLRVQVYPTADSSYGYGIGYLKICVTQREITQDVIDGVDFGLGDELHFTYDGQPHQPSTEGVPSYLHVEFSGSATNVCEGEVTVTATFTIADKNYKFADGVSPTRKITVVIDPYEITHIVWSDREYTYNGTDQKEDVYAYFVDVFGVEHRLRVTADGDFKNVTADGTKFTALLELYEEQEDFCIQNYKFAEGHAERTHVYKMAKATVEIGIGDAEAVYTGEPIEIDQTQYALRTAISLSDPEILKFLSMIRLIAVDTEGNPAVNVGEYQIILKEKEWTYTNIEIVFNDSYAGQLTVSPAPLEVPVLDETQFVYNGSVQKPR